MLSNLRPEQGYRTRGGLQVYRHETPLRYKDAVEPLIDALDRRRGVLLSSGFEFPGRYARWDLGFVDPPLAITARARDFELAALNARGTVLLPPIAAAVEMLDAVERLSVEPERITGAIRPAGRRFPEEMRSRQPSIFSLLRSIVELFGSGEDRHLGLYGAFGYDLAFQFEPVRQRRARPADQRDLVLYLPDEILVVDHMSRRASRLSYEFRTALSGTDLLARRAVPDPYRSGTATAAEADHGPGAYPAAVERARAAFRRGDLFEAVLSQLFTEPCADTPATLYRRLRQANPSPYGALMNLGAGEFLVAASPEMYVRVEGQEAGGRRIETCPISGTIARGKNAIGDAAQILTLLNSAKDAAELTMCTDVDRNDKSRICEPGSVRVIGRRQVELYSRLIHTVDHVEGVLRPEFDALDAFLSHSWAVTVTGAPKHGAMQFIEDQEKSVRRWYGGAIGRATFDGGMNTGLTLRTIRMKDGMAEVRVGATLLCDSDPEAEDAECRLKAAALFAAIRPPAPAAARQPVSRPGDGRRILLVDHEDSFVHTLADYFRQTGAEVVTLRTEAARAALAADRPDLVVLSPGPGRPSGFDLSATLEKALARDLPVFGVCLGLQGIAEHFGGRLAVLAEPAHGRASELQVLGGRLFDGLPKRFSVGRYDSLHACGEVLPEVLRITARTDDGVVMALEHAERPIAAVQFHPESILTLTDDLGLRLIRNAVSVLCAAPVA